MRAHEFEVEPEGILLVRIRGPLSHRLEIVLSTFTTNAYAQLLPSHLVYDLSVVKLCGFRDH